MSKHLPPRTCLLVHAVDPERPRTATRGHLCEGHYLGLEQLLAEMPALSSEAARSLTPVRDEWRTATRDPEQALAPLSLRPTALPFDERVSDTARKVRDLLASWASIVVEEHPDQLTPPQFTIEAVSAFLLRWLPWIVEQPWVDDLRSELNDGRKALQAALTPLRSRRVPLGPCGSEVACEVDTGALVTCDGIMEAVVKTNDEHLPAEIACTVCGLTKQPHEWRALSKRLRGDKDPMLTAAQLSQVFRVPVGTLQRWAGEDDWRRDTLVVQDRGRITRYHHDDAQKSYDAHPERHPEQEAS